MKNDPAFFDDTPIGRVDDIEYTDAGHFLVEVSIENQFSSWPKTSSTFYIGSNPNAESRNAVRNTPGADSGEKIEQLRRLLEKNGKEEKLDRVEEKMQKLSEQVTV